MEGKEEQDVQHRFRPALHALRRHRRRPALLLWEQVLVIARSAGVAARQGGKGRGTREDGDGEMGAVRGLEARGVPAHTRQQYLAAGAGALCGGAHEGGADVGNGHGDGGAVRRDGTREREEGGGATRGEDGHGDVRCAGTPCASSTRTCGSRTPPGALQRWGKRSAGTGVDSTAGAPTRSVRSTGSGGGTHTHAHSEKARVYALAFPQNKPDLPHPALELLLQILHLLRKSTRSTPARSLCYMAGGEPCLHGKLGEERVCREVSVEEVEGEGEPEAETARSVRARIDSRDSEELEDAVLDATVGSGLRPASGGGGRKWDGKQDGEWEGRRGRKERGVEGRMGRGRQKGTSFHAKIAGLVAKAKARAYKMEGPGLLYSVACVAEADIVEYRRSARDAAAKKRLCNAVNLKAGHTKNMRRRQSQYKRCDARGIQRHIWLCSYPVQCRYCVERLTHLNVLDGGGVRPIVDAPAAACTTTSFIPARPSVGSAVCTRPSPAFWLRQGRGRTAGSSSLTDDETPLCRRSSDDDPRINFREAETHADTPSFGWRIHAAETSSITGRFRAADTPCSPTHFRGVETGADTFRIRGLGTQSEIPHFPFDFGTTWFGSDSSAFAGLPFHARVISDYEDTSGPNIVVHPYNPLIVRPWTWNPARGLAPEEMRMRTYARFHRDTSCGALISLTQGTKGVLLP
ncbi:hypothetical protein C8F04DRAFT_1177217 [Mycena alexandri]|uniref:Uncharacterized protein n=1 Tax=Mycena alexandri TaxID=1745969 RepID=A0AAD6TCF0_9AGAR|nr:hypothetical protein C8F04DRAFT_1177217 [Mycena alexandri]